MEKEKDDFTSLRIIFFALLTGQLMFMVVSFITAVTPTVPDPELDIFLYLVPAVILSAHLIGSLLFNRLTTREKIFYSDGKPNINNVRSAYIIRWALLEGANLFAGISYLITGNVYFIYFFLGGIALFLTLMPKKIWENYI